MATWTILGKDGKRIKLELKPGDMFTPLRDGQEAVQRRRHWNQDRRARCEFPFFIRR